jgi:hypothetical protein
MNEMRPTQLTRAPEGFGYYRVCDQEGVWHVARGMREDQQLLEKTPGLTVTKIPSLKKSCSGGLFTHYRLLTFRGQMTFSSKQIKRARELARQRRKHVAIQRLLINEFNLRPAQCCALLIAALAEERAA